MDAKAYKANCNQLNKIPLPRLVSFLLELVRWTQVLNQRLHELESHESLKLTASVERTDGGVA